MWDLYRWQLHKTRPWQGVTLHVSPGCDEWKDKHFEHPHEEFSREREVDFSLEGESKVWVIEYI